MISALDAYEDFPGGPLSPDEFAREARAELDELTRDPDAGGDVVSHWICNQCQEGNHHDCRDRHMCWCARFHTAAEDIHPPEKPDPEGAS